MILQGQGFNILSQKEREKKGKTFMDYAPGHVGDDNYLITQSTIIPNANTNTRTANKSGKTNTATITKEPKRQPFSWSDDDFLEGWNSVYNDEQQKSTADELRQTRERLNNIVNRNKRAYGGSYRWATTPISADGRTQTTPVRAGARRQTTTQDNDQDRTFLEGLYDVDGATTQSEREERTAQVENALRDIQRRFGKSTSGATLRPVFPSRPDTSEIQNLPYRPNGNSYPACTNYNVSNNFSVNPRFSNTLYSEKQPEFFNGNIPQKNYHIGEKSIYGENTDEGLDAISNILTAASLVPGIDTFADVAAIPVDLLRGDYISAGLDALGIFPFVGEVADTAKLARTGIRVADKAHDVEKVIDAVKIADKADDVTDVAKAADDIKFPDVKYPGDDPSIPPGIGFEWRGKQPPSEGLGAWYNPEKNVSFHWDLEHSEPIAPHWDYIDEHHNFFRIYKDGRIELTKKGERKSGKEFK